jgi:hypothetical protein
MSDPTPIPADDERDPEVEAPDVDAEQASDELAPEERELKGWLPEPTPTEGTAPAP